MLTANINAAKAQLTHTNPDHFEGTTEHLSLFAFVPRQPQCNKHWKVVSLGSAINGFLGIVTRSCHSEQGFLEKPGNARHLKAAPGGPQGQELFQRGSCPLGMQTQSSPQAEMLHPHATYSFRMEGKNHHSPLGKVHNGVWLASEKFHNKIIVCLHNLKRYNSNVPLTMSSSPSNTSPALQRCETAAREPDANTPSIHRSLNAMFQFTQR